jgi:bifunctional DNA-binding transcriptional regulator/antitoxin component of YhaV-PrlF toxin-antitoxin module
MENGIEIKKVDAQGRLVLPADWRESQLEEGGDVFVLKTKGFLKIVPKQKVNLTKFFDSADLGVDAIGDWKEFERKFYMKMKK